MAATLPTNTEVGASGSGAGDVHPAKLVGRRYLFHFPGLIYVLTTVVLVLGAINGQNNLLFIIFGLAVGGLIVSGLLSGANLVGIHIDRLPSRSAVVGETAALRYVVRNRNRFFGSFALTIEELPDRRGDSHAPKLLEPAFAFAWHVPARGGIEVESSPRGLARGVAVVKRFRVVSSFPFGITKKAVIFECTDEVLIHPPPAKLLRPVIGGGGGERVRGGTARPWRGGQDFFSLRDFSSGDSVRSVAWRASARAGSMLVKETCVPRSTRVFIEFDASSPDIAARERCLSAAVGLAFEATEHGYEVAIGESGGGMLTRFANDGEHSSKPRERAMVDALARWKPRTGETEGSQASGPRADLRRGVLHVEIRSGRGAGTPGGSGGGIVNGDGGGGEPERRHVVVSADDATIFEYRSRAVEGEALP